MKRTQVILSVNDVAEQIKRFLKEKGFTIFCDIDHQANAKEVDLAMPESRTLIFGNPLSGTRLMQKDIAISLDLPLRMAIVDDGGNTTLLHQTSDDYGNHYQVKNHPVLEKVDALFSAIASQLQATQ